MRDSAGRLREEQLASAPDANGGFIQGNVHIVDPATMLDIQRQEDTRTVLTSNFSPISYLSWQRPIVDCTQRIRAENAEPSRNNSVRDQVTYEDLGSRDVDGLAAVGCRITRIIAKKSEIMWSGTSITEIWSSPELQINLFTTLKESDGTEQITTLKDLRRIELNPALFQVPLGYTDPTKATGSAQ